MNIKIILSIYMIGDIDIQKSTAWNDVYSSWLPSML